MRNYSRCKYYSIVVSLVLSVLLIKLLQDIVFSADPETCDRTYWLYHIITDGPYHSDLFTGLGSTLEFLSIIAVTHTKCATYASGQSGFLDGREHMHSIVSIKSGKQLGRLPSAITKSHTILARRKYFRCSGKQCPDCKEISNKRINRERCTSCGAAIRVKALSSKRYLLNCLRYLHHAVEPEKPSQGVELQGDEELTEYLGVGEPGNGSSTPKHEDDPQKCKSNFWTAADAPWGGERPGVRTPPPSERPPKRFREDASASPRGGNEKTRIPAELLDQVRDLRATLRRNMAECDGLVKFLEGWMETISRRSSEQEQPEQRWSDASTQTLGKERKR